MQTLNIDGSGSGSSYAVVDKNDGSTNTTTTTPKEEASWWEIANDQDFQQKVTVVIKLSLELYRVVIASFLLLFVPQLCGDHLCSIEENAETGVSKIYDWGFSLNCVTLIVFIIMYIAEYLRESKLIAYLDVNPSLKFDNESVKETLAKLDSDQWMEIQFSDQCYKWTGGIALFVFLVNTVLSGVVISEYYMGDKTAVNFITSVLFMISKMSVVYTTVRTEPHVLHSAFLTVQCQFNDIENKNKSKTDNAIP